MAEDYEAAYVDEGMDEEFHEEIHEQVFGEFDSEDDEDDQLITDISAALARKGADIQGIPWGRLCVTREKYRRTRLEQYKIYENIDDSGKESEKECKATQKGGNYYEFQRNTRSAKSSILHFQFPSMASLQRALPDIAAPPSIPPTSSLNNPSPHWMAPQDSSYGSAVPPASYASTLPPSPYMVQQIPNNMSTLGYQGIGYSGANEGIFGTSNKSQQMTGIYSKPGNQNSFTSFGGNPFG